MRDIKTELRRLERLSESGDEDAVRQYAALYKEVQDRRKTDRIKKNKRYTVKNYFSCDNQMRLYRFLEKLKDLAISFKSRDPSPVYKGQGIFSVSWAGGRADLTHDCINGIVQLETTELIQKDYRVVKKVFQDYWAENYSHAVNSKVRESRKYKPVDYFGDEAKTDNQTTSQS
jgi:hypothetical protein